jgi:hypothetical protein
MTSKEEQAQQARLLDAIAYGVKSIKGECACKKRIETKKANG